MNTELDPAGEEFARHARERLRDSVEALPAQTRSRLTRARHAALEQAARRTRAWQWQWLPAGAAAAAVLAVLLLNAPRPMPELQQAATGGGEDLELLADSDALALAQDQPAQDPELDYEFYDWAVREAQQEGAGGVGS